MLRITIPSIDIWDEVHERFIKTREQDLELEHSLIALSKWESKWHKSFLSRRERTTEEIIDYIRCMTLTPNVDPSIYNYLGDKNIDKVIAYWDDPMTATTIHEEGNGSGGREIITSELIYYWMISFNIPVEFENWHLNRLLTLIRVCNIKNAPKKKRGGRDAINRHLSTNAKRRAEIEAARKKEGI